MIHLLTKINDRCPSDRTSRRLAHVLSLPYFHSLKRRSTTPCVSRSASTGSYHFRHLAHGPLAIQPAHDVAGRGVQLHQPELLAKQHQRSVLEIFYCNLIPKDVMSQQVQI